MQKELNPELFGGGASGATRYLDANKLTPVTTATQTDTRYVEMRSQLNVLSEHMAKMASQVNEFIKSSQGKFDRIQQLIQKFESSQTQMINENNQKFSLLHHRIGERKSVDQKIQEMIDRHHSVLRSYEVRMNQLQKLLADKEAHIIDAQSALNEAKMEIARLKRL